MGSTSLSNMAYEQVLRDFGLPRGTKLHKDEERVKLWQRYFALFSELAKDALLSEAAESEDPLLREAAE
jgi:hypothetical protein